jgi:hypothetical protein
LNHAAIRLLDGLVGAGLAVEITHRSWRRLFGLKAMAPLAGAVRPPYRPDPGRGRGRPPILADDDEITGPPPLLPPLTPIERRAFDYSELERCMALLDLSIGQTKRALDIVARGRESQIEAVLAQSAGDSDRSGRVPEVSG